MMKTIVAYSSLALVATYGDGMVVKRTSASRNMGSNLIRLLQKQSEEEPKAYDIVLLLALQYVNESVATIFESNQSDDAVLAHFCQSVNSQASGNQVNMVDGKVKIETKILLNSNGPDFQCSILQTNRKYDNDSGDLLGPKFFTLEVAVQQTLYVTSQKAVSLSEVMDTVERGFSRGTGGRVKFKSLLHQNSSFASILNIEILSGRNLSPPQSAPTSSPSTMPQTLLAPSVPPTTLVSLSPSFPQNNYEFSNPSSVPTLRYTTENTTSSTDQITGENGPSQALILGALVGGILTILVSTFFIFCLWFPTCKQKVNKVRDRSTLLSLQHPIQLPDQTQLQNSCNSDNSSSTSSKNIPENMSNVENSPILILSPLDSTQVGPTSLSLDMTESNPSVEQFETLESFDDNSLYTASYLGSTLKSMSNIFKSVGIVEEESVKDLRSLEEESDKDIATVEDDRDNEDQRSSESDVDMFPIVPTFGNSNRFVTFVGSDEAGTPEFDVVNAFEDDASSFGFDSITLSEPSFGHSSAKGGDSTSSRTKLIENIPMMPTVNRQGSGNLPSEIQDETRVRDKLKDYRLQDFFSRGNARSNTYTNRPNTVRSNNSLLRNVLEDAKHLARSRNSKSKRSLVSAPPRLSQMQDFKSEYVAKEDSFVIENDLLADNHDLEANLDLHQPRHVERSNEIIINGIDYPSTQHHTFADTDLALDQAIKREPCDELPAFPMVAEAGDAIIARCQDDDLIVQMSPTSCDGSDHPPLELGRLGAKRRKNQWHVRADPSDDVSPELPGIKETQPPNNIFVDFSADSNPSLLANGGRWVRSCKSQASLVSNRSRISRSSGWSTGSSKSVETNSFQSATIKGFASGNTHDIESHRNSLSSSGPVIDGLDSSEDIVEDCGNSLRQQSLEQSLKQLEMRFGELPRKLPSRSVASSQTGIRSKTRVIVAVPPGKLGIVLANRLNEKGAFVSEVRTSSSVYGLLRPGDKVVGVDDNDVSEMLVGEITSMMSERSDKERHITVLTSVVEQSAGGLSSKQSTTSIGLSVD